jgi:hypothetical protein
MTGLKEKELLSNLVELEKALWSSLGYGADILLKRLSDELARNVDRAGIGFAEVLDELKRDEQAVFARSISQGENMALLYSSTGFRNRIVSAFFDPMQGGGAMAALIERPSGLPPSVTNDVRRAYRRKDIDFDPGRRVGVCSAPGRLVPEACQGQHLAC